MCRNNAYATSEERHMERFDLRGRNFYDRTEFASMPDAFVAAYHSQPIIIQNEQKEKVSRSAFWGLLPAKTDLDTVTEYVKRARSTVNARAEEVWTKPLYKGLVREYRCIVPSTGYWEYHYDMVTVQLKTKTKEEERKTPMLVTKKDTDIFSIAGLYTVVHGLVSNMALTTFTMFTIAANEKMRVVHNGGEYPFRMPLVLQDDQEAAWLDPTISIEEINELLAYQVPSNNLTIWPTVSPLKRERVRGEALYQQVEVPNLDVDLSFLAA